ncbi:hypothetical protein MJD09_20345 [bacterium]|nr:hypothetical protein [bacterium]
MQRIIATLVLVLSYGLQAQVVLTKDEIVASIPARDETGRSLELKWGITEPTNNNNELFVAVHAESPPAFGSTHRVAIYKRIGDRFQLLEELEDDVTFKKPHFFRCAPVNSEFREHLLQITEIHYGTAHNTREHIFRVTVSGDIEKVKFTSAPQAFQSRLQEGESVWKGEVNDFSERELRFTFFIWRKGDANCCPTGGKVTGRYELVETPQSSFEIRVAEFTREPYDHLNK